MKFGMIGPAALLCLVLASAQAAPVDPPTAARDAERYCTSHGGAVQERIPEYGTNNPNPLVLGGSREFCQFTSKKDGSQINVLVGTLATPLPSLAALAYYAKVPLASGCAGNPASCYCSQLGGSDLFGGVNAAGGGWVLSTDSTDVLEACIFPDLSSIDSWGLAYHSDSIVRGRDLATALKYKNPHS